MKTKAQTIAEHSFHPAVCHYCGSPVSLIEKSEVSNSAKAGEQVYCCDGCHAYVGCRPGTKRAVGSLANEATRKARGDAHKAIRDLIAAKRLGDEKQVYLWLRNAMNLPPHRSGISWLRADECQKMIREIEAVLLASRIDAGNKGVAAIRELFSKHDKATEQVAAVKPEARAGTGALSKMIDRLGSRVFQF